MYICSEAWGLQFRLKVRRVCGCVCVCVCVCVCGWGDEAGVGEPISILPKL